MNQAEWTHQLEQILLKTGILSKKEIAFTFPWEECTALLTKNLSLPSLKLSAEKGVLKNNSSLLDNLGGEPVCVKIELSPLAEPVYWLFSKEDIFKITRLLLSPKIALEGLSDFRFQVGFYHFFLLRVLTVLEESAFFKNISFRLLDSPVPTLEKAFCSSLVVELGESTFCGKLLYTETFLHHFVEHSPLSQKTLLENEEAKQVEVPLSLSMGHLHIHPEEWESVQIGDFVKATHCSFDPVTHKGAVLFLTHTEPLLRARVKAEGLKVSDYAFQYADAPSLEEEVPLPEEIALPPPPVVDTSSLHINLEAGRGKMTVSTLLHLTPGSSVDFTLFPGQEVILTLKEKEIGKGEILKLGETLGVRVLEKKSHG